MHKMMNLTDEEKNKMIQGGLNHVSQNYSLEKFVSSWSTVLEGVHSRYGSWDTRKGYTGWQLLEVA